MGNKLFKYFVTVLLFVTSVGICANKPPSPLTERARPPDMPINDHLIPILLISLLFGAYMIYRYNQKQKNPV